MTETNPLFDQVYVFCGGALLLSGLLLGVWFFGRWWQRQQARRQRLAGLGYTPQAQTPAALLARVAAVYRRQGQRQFRLDDLFHRPLAGGDLYLFDLVDKTEGENPVVAEVLAVVSPHLDLPHFRLEPRSGDGDSQRLPGVGWRPRAAEGRGSGDGFTVLEFGDMPAFDERYQVWAEEEGAVRSFLTAGRGEQLVDLKRSYRIAAAGEAFTMVRAGSARPPRSEEGASLDEAARLADAETLLALFRDEGAGIGDWESAGTPTNP